MTPTLLACQEYSTRAKTAATGARKDLQFRHWVRLIGAGAGRLSRISANSGSDNRQKRC